MKLRICIFIFICTIFSNLACKSSESSTEGLFSNPPKWSVYYGYKDALLLQIPPNGTLIICADTEESGKALAQAIDDWAYLIGRDEYINVEVRDENSCKNSISNDSTFFFSVKRNYKEEYYHIRVQAWIEKDFVGYKSEYGLDYVTALRFAGILWGLCDTSKEDPPYYVCLSRYRWKKMAGFGYDSVMGGSGKVYHSDDDIAAIMSVTSFDDVGANLKWKEFFANLNNKVKKLKTMFNPSCISKGQVSFSEPHLNKVYVSDKCSDPANPKFEYSDKIVTMPGCDSKDSRLVGGYPIRIAEVSGGYVAQECTSKTMKSWFMPYIEE